MELLEASKHTFDTIIGQDLAKRFLMKATEQQQLPHALMLTGPQGVGKRSLMYAFAKHMVTQHLEPDSAAADKAIGKVERGTHPDVLAVMPKSASGQILKEQIEEMHERAYYAPLEASCKIVLLAPTERLNDVAANDLLKLLEEPPNSFYMLLSSENIHQVLTTIRSRCALLRCPPVETGVLAEWLGRIGRCSQRRAETAAALSGGKPGLAYDLLGGDNEERRRRMCNELEFFSREGYQSILRVADNLLQAAEGDPQEAFEMLIAWYRDLLVAGLVGAQEADDMNLLVNRDLNDRIRESLASDCVEGIARALEVLFRHMPTAARPFVDNHLLMTVAMTDVGLALKSA